jgi:hypothetical protein
LNSCLFFSTFLCDLKRNLKWGCVGILSCSIGCCVYAFPVFPLLDSVEVFFLFREKIKFVALLESDEIFHYPFDCFG